MPDNPWPNSGTNIDNSGGLQDTVPVTMDPANAKRVVDWSRKQFAQMKGERVSVENQWYLNLAFYAGKQNVVDRNRNMAGSFTSTTTANLWTPPAPHWRARPVVNRVRPTIRTELAKLTGQKPSAFIVPASSEDRDLYAATAGEQIWETTYRDKKIKKTTRRAVFWAITCGTGFFKHWWDPTEVDKANDQMGDICIQAETPFHIFVPNLREEELEDQAFIFHAQTKSRDWCKLYFPQFQGNSSFAGESSIVEPVWLNMVSGGASAEQNKVLVMECWVKPGTTTMFPQGAMFTVIGDQLVQFMEGWPYYHNEYPFSKIDHIPTGKFYGESSIVDLIPLQREINRTHGQIIEAKNRMAKPQLMAYEGSVDPTRMTSEPGQVVLVQPGFQFPTPIPMQALPSYVAQELERLYQDWADISGIHEVSQGQTPAGVTAATAISYLQEQDETKLSHTVFSIEDALEKVAKQTLQYVQQYWDSERTIKVVGEDGSFDYLAFKGSDLRDNTDIQIEAGSALPTSRAAKQAFIMDLMKMQFISPDEGLEVLDMGGVNRLQERREVDKKQAQRENLRMGKVTPDMLAMHSEQQMQKVMESGAQLDPQTNLPTDPATGDIVPPELLVAVNSWDNHVLHIEQHNNYRKGQAFEDASPEVKDLFDQHVQQHLDAIAAIQDGMLQQDAQQAQASMNPPTPPAAQAAMDQLNTPPEQLPPTK